MEFIEYNLNPTGKKSGDCVVRAIAKGSAQTWIKVYDDLCVVGREMFNIPNTKKVYEEYLKRCGWKKQSMPRHEDRTRYTVRQFADENKKGTFIISVANHLTVIQDGKLYDTWNCSQKCLGNYWK